MFQDLCRACLSLLNPLDSAPLFETYQETLLHHLCNSLQLPLDENDNMPPNVCKSCAEEIIKSYKFRLTYMESYRKLHGRRRQCKHSAEASVDTVTKWKCNSCSAVFENRSLLCQHKLLHRLHKTEEGSREEVTKNGMNEHHQQDVAATNEFCEMNGVKYDSASDTTTDNDFQVGSNDIEVAENVSSSETDQRDFKFVCVKTEAPSDTESIIDGFESNHFNYSEEGTDTKTWKHKKDAESFGTRHLLDVNVNDELKDEFKAPNKIIKDEGVVTEDVQNNGKFRWKCTTCNHSFETRDLLRSHRKNHFVQRKSTGPKVWQCTFCLSTFPSRNECRIHRRNEHPNRRRKHNGDNYDSFTCDICDKTFPSKLKIRQHMEAHRDKERKKRLCTICGLKLCTTNNLNVHIRVVHGNERRFACTICDRRFSHGYLLNTHMNRHNNYRPFPCLVTNCDKAFYDKTNLRTHHRSVHLNMKSFVCEVCSKPFSRRDNLKAHLVKVHNRFLHPFTMKSFDCPICTKTFSRNDKLRSHLLKVHQQQSDAPRNIKLLKVEQPCQQQQSN